MPPETTQVINNALILTACSVNLRQKKMKPCFQITSSKLEAELLFRDEEDYIYGMNTLALILLLFPGVTVYAFVLMSNHIHLVLGGPKEECEAYYDAVMHRLSLWLRKKYGLSGIVPYGPKNRTTVTVTGLEHFTIEVLYSLRNPFKAKICYPGDYPWSSVGMYFSRRGQMVGRKASTFTARELRRILKTNMRIPGNWEITDSGMIVPHFIAWKVVEKAFDNDEGTFLRKLMEPVEARHNQMSGLPIELKYSDQELAVRVRTICQKELKVDDHRQLPNKELLRLCRTLAIRYGSSSEQLQRVVGVDKAILEDLL